MADQSRLSRERIVEASFGLLEREGWEALSMRRLAQELDVWPMAVYRYFRDKDELVDALVDHVVQTVDLPGEPEGSWQDQVGALLDAARVTLARLPPELRTRLASALLAPGAPRLAATGVELLESAGFEEDGARRAWSTLAAYTAGYVEIAPETSFEYGLERLLDGLEDTAEVAHG